MTNVDLGLKRMGQPADAERVRHLFFGTYPPRQCGIATFTRDLIEAFDGSTRGFSEVVAVDDAPAESRYAYSGRVIRRLSQNDRAAYGNLARFVNGPQWRTLNIQHEFGIFGGTNGVWVLDLMEQVDKPIILTMHTVLPRPSPADKSLVRRLCASTAQVVVLSETAQQLLTHRYGIAPRLIRTLPHGIPDLDFSPTEPFKHAWGFDGRFVVSTFGLLSRGKGLETAIDAIADVAKTLPEVLYLILGATHPLVARREGESYREELRARVRARVLDRNVLMIDRFLTISDLLLYLAASDAYVTPYTNPDQTVSGTLALRRGIWSARRLDAISLCERAAWRGSRNHRTVWRRQVNGGGSYQTCF